MIQNIFLIVLVIILFFLISNDKKMDQIINKKYMKYLLLLLIIYFIYQNYNFGIFIAILVIFIFLNTDLQKDFKKRFANNKYLYLDEYSELAKEYFSNMDSSKEIPKSSYEVKPYIPAAIETTSEVYNEDNTKDIEPFRNEVAKLKEMYENIKMEIKNIG